LAISNKTKVLDQLSEKRKVQVWPNDLSLLPSNVIGQEMNNIVRILFDADR